MEDFVRVYVGGEENPYRKLPRRKFLKYLERFLKKHPNLNRRNAEWAFELALEDPTIEWYTYEYKNGTIELRAADEPIIGVVCDDNVPDAVESALTNLELAIENGPVDSEEEEEARNAYEPEPPGLKVRIKHRRQLWETLTNLSMFDQDTISLFANGDWTIDSAACCCLETSDGEQIPVVAQYACGYGAMEGWQANALLAEWEELLNNPKQKALERDEL